MAEGEQQVLENVITSEQPPATEEVKIEEAPAGGSGKLENNSENQEKSKK